MSFPWADRVIAAVRSPEGMKKALDTQVSAIFLLSGNPFTLPVMVEEGIDAGRKVFVHIDLMEGFSKDAAGIRWLARTVKPTGILTTRAPLIRAAKEEKLTTVLRVFLIDSSSVATAEKAIRACEPDYVEVMPGLVSRGLSALKARITQPLIAGGMLETQDDVEAAVKAGAVRISTSNEELWNQNDHKGKGNETCYRN